MKKLIYVLLISLLVFGLIGCNEEVVPEPVVEEEVVPYEGVGELVCAGGHYSVFYKDWTRTGCEGEWYAKGTYWINADGKEFLVSTKTPYDPNIATEIVDTFGVCPDSYIKIAEFIE